MALKIGVQLQPQATTTDALRTAWRAADQAGAASIWVWDHFYPLHGDPDAAHFEGYTLLAAMAVETERAALGAMGHLQQLSQPRAAGRHGPHHRPPVRRALHPRDRRRLVRA